MEETVKRLEETLTRWEKTIRNGILLILRKWKLQIMIKICKRQLKLLRKELHHEERD